MGELKSLSEAAILLDALIRPQLIGLIGVAAGVNKARQQALLVYVQSSVGFECASVPPSFEGFPVEVEKMTVKPL